jgi:hypothetical protein
VLRLVLGKQTQLERPVGRGQKRAAALEEEESQCFGRGVLFFVLSAARSFFSVSLSHVICSPASSCMMLALDKGTHTSVFIYNCLWHEKAAFPPVFHFSSHYFYDNAHFPFFITVGGHYDTLHHFE